MLGSVTDSLHIDGNSCRPGGESAIDHLIAALAWRHYGVVTREQLLGLGLSEDAITYRVEIGRLRVIHRGVYAVGHERLSPEGRWLAAVHSGGAGAVLSHRSAARHWGLLPWDGKIEVTTPRTRRKRADIHYVRASVDAGERTVHRAIPVTPSRRRCSISALSMLLVSRKRSSRRKCSGCWTFLNCITWWTGIHAVRGPAHFVRRFGRWSAGAGSLEASSRLGSAS